MGFVYLLGDFEQENIYKIGITRKNIDKRIKQLQTGNSGEIFLLKFYETEYPFLIERFLHQKFKVKNKKGEWFYLEPENVHNFEKLCKDFEETIISLKDNYYFKKIK